MLMLSAKWGAVVRGGWCFLFAFSLFFMEFLCVSQKGFWPKKVEIFLPIVFSLRFFYRVFGRFSACGAQTHYTNIFLKSDLKISKNLKKKVPWYQYFFNLGHTSIIGHL
jgi:hypothetical protein